MPERVLFCSSTMSFAATFSASAWCAGRLDLRLGDLRVGDLARRIELAGLHPHREQARQRASTTPFESSPRSMAALMFCVVISPPAQLSCGPGADREGLAAGCGRDLLAGGVVGPARAVAGPARRGPAVRGGAVDVADRAAVGGGVAGEAVGGLQELVDGVRIGRGRRAVDRVVGRHDAGHVGVLHQAGELLGVVVADVGVRGVRAAGMAAVLDVVQGVVLRRGRDLQVRGLLAARSCSGPDSRRRTPRPSSKSGTGPRRTTRSSGPTADRGPY